MAALRKAMELPEEASKVFHGATPPVGSRHDEMVNVAYILARNGSPNDLILLVLDHLCEHWGKYPGPYDRWTRLLSILRAVRKEYPNSTDGNGYAGSVRDAPDVH